MRVSITGSGGVVFGGAAVVEVNLNSPPQFGLRTGKLALDIYGAGGGAYLGALQTILSARVEEGVGELGAFEVVVPLIDPALSKADVSREVILWREGETEPVMPLGVITDLQDAVDAQGRYVCVITGLSGGVELLRRLTHWGEIFDDETVANAVTQILGSSGWTGVATAGGGFVNITDRYDGMTMWQALKRLAESQDAYVRLTDTLREVEVKQGSSASGIRLVNPEYLSPEFEENASIGLVSSVRRRKSGLGIVNRLFPWGEDAGNVVFDLGLSDRSSPYTIQSFIKNRPSVAAVNSGGLWEASLGIDVVGMNTAVVLFVGIETAVSILTATCGGKPMERLFDRFDAGGVAHLDVWYAVGVKGTAAIDVVWDDQTAPPANMAVAVALQDVDQRSPVRDSDSSNSTTASPSTPTIDTDDDDLVLGCVKTTTTASISARGSGQSEVADISYPANNRISVDEEDGVSPSASMSWTLSANVENQRGVVSFRPAITYYIEDSASIAAYGLSEDSMIESASKLVGATDAQLVAAANTLYDLASTRLARLKDPVIFYECDTPWLPHRDWLPGDLLTLDFRNPLKNEDGERVTSLDIDEALIAMRRAQTFGEDNVRHWDLTLASDYRQPPEETDLMRRAIERIAALESARS